MLHHVLHNSIIYCLLVRQKKQNQKKEEKRKSWTQEIVLKLRRACLGSHRSRIREQSKSLLVRFLVDAAEASLAWRLWHPPHQPCNNISSNNVMRVWKWRYIFFFVYYVCQTKIHMLRYFFFLGWGCMVMLWDSINHTLI